ncbi:hypothetical protein ACHMW6_14140 [Pseudoduganella sp. UC29_106]|uniref:hypothetical protein n=1 Tax=Pseudoduganella sp. UC29_106 TaxID=3374553 RepID=UPI0037573FA6
MTTSDKEYFDGKLDSMKQSFDASLDAMKQSFDARFDAMNAHIDQRTQELKAELHQTIGQTVKWSAAIAASTLMIFVTIIAFLMNNAVPRTAPVAPAAQPAPAPQPIVIVVPLKS